MPQLKQLSLLKVYNSITNSIYNKNMIIAKMMKGKSEPKEELATDTKCIQCDYWTKTGK